MTWWTLHHSETKCRHLKDEMADAASFRDEVSNPKALRRNSVELLPPKMSESPTELRIVLLGKNGSKKSVVGNFILERGAFDPNYVQNHCERARGQVEDKHIAVINTPDLSHDKLSEELRWCVTLSDPGPHVFLLVLQPEEFTQEEGDRIRKILDTLSDRSFDYSMVLTTHEDKRGHMAEDHPLNQMVKACRGRQHLMHLSDHTQLIADVDKIVKENGGDYLTCDVFEDTSGIVQGKEEIHRSKTDGSLKSFSEEELGKDVLEQGESAQLNKWENIRETGLVSFKQERLKPSSSHEKLSSLRILLLGKSDDKKSTVGNMILQKEAFRPAHFFNYKQPCESASGKVNGKSVTVVKTPDFFASPLTVRSLMQEMEKCKSLSAPGPHGVLLVLKPEEFTEENRNTFKLILNIFGKEAFKYSMVIITHEGLTGNPHLSQMIEECGGRHHEMYKQGCDHKELTETIEKMVEENEWRYLTSNEETTHDTMTPKAQRLNVVLCGRRGAGKTSIANAILGQTESSPKSSSSSVCVKREGEVCGRPVTLIELPALFGTHLTQEEVMRETFHCVSLCDSGVHAFLLVVPLGPITDEDKGELETIQKILSSRVNDFVMVLFRQDNIPVDKTAVDFVEQNADTKQLIKICGGRYKIFDASKIDNAKQTTELVAEIVKMMDQNRTCYTLYMYMEAKHQSELDQNNRIIKDLEEIIRNMSQGAEMECSSTECIRVVLIGKTGNGKSASANTILGRDEFESESSTDSVTTVCKKAVGKVDGRTVSVVDTPGLFDTTLSNKDVQQEIVKCVSLSAPGPHVFIIVLSIGRITQEELDTLDLIETTFGPRAGMFCLVLFTRGDDLKKKSIQDYIGNSKSATLKKLIRDCGDRFHVFNNRVEDDRTQVTELLKKINEMVSMNKGSFYTNEMFQEAETAIKHKQEAILKERETEIKADMEKLKVRHETDMEKMKSKLEEERFKVQQERQLRENMLREREEAIRKEHEDKEKADKEERELEDKKRKEDEKLKREIWDTEKEKMEKEIKTQEIKLEKQQREKEREYQMRMEKLRKEEKDREERQINQERKFDKLKRKQEEEIKRREKEEDERRKKDEKERQEWQSKIEEAEKGQTELQEVMRREKEEWEEQLKKERDRQQEEERLRRQMEADTLVEQEEKQRRLREEFERERERDRIKMKESEERIEKDFEEKRRDLTDKMTTQREQWERERGEEQERRFQEDVNRRVEERLRLRKLEETFQQEREEENMRKEMEDEVRREQEEKKWKEMKADYERKTKENMDKYEQEARRHAEEMNNFKEKYENDFQKLLDQHEEEKEKLILKHKGEYDLLNALYGHDKTKLTEKINELQETHEEEIKHLYKCVVL
ncbi:citron Rho-interacting kinase isoform X2 [Oncorhynchus kisutch]|uniref:citron Rho-interacting kinase isoform X2 n=1 Tax=Oncorhynchus kisutch TaxID=8019 RepID=UPI0012DD0929|nr:citron Rho-interacting kinase isoform X2 [Oncorhynchus kisutch]